MTGAKGPWRKCTVCGAHHALWHGHQWPKLKFQQPRFKSPGSAYQAPKPDKRRKLRPVKPKPPPKPKPLPKPKPPPPPKIEPAPLPAPPPVQVDMDKVKKFLAKMPPTTY